MSKLDSLKKHLKQGHVYRREDLGNWTTSVDRHLQNLLLDGTLEKLAQGLYYAPAYSTFGKVPPKDTTLVAAFLKDNRFLLTSPNAYNSLGVGTTQLYNELTVYNYKRHAVIQFGNRTYNFKKRPAFPLKASEEFLLVDLVNNLDSLAEEEQFVLEKVKIKISSSNKTLMKRCITRYGDVKTKKLLMPLFN